MATWTAGSLGTWTVTDDAISKTDLDGSWSSYIKSTGELLGSATQTVTGKFTGYDSTSSMYFGFNSGALADDPEDCEWAIETKPTGQQEISFWHNGSKTELTSEIYNGLTQWTIVLSPTSIIYKKDGVTRLTRTTGLPDSGTTYYLQANSYKQDDIQTVTYAGTPSTGGTRLPPPPIVVAI